jgi:hypothetical protein
VAVATGVEDVVVLVRTVTADDPIPLLTLAVEDITVEDNDTLDTPGMESGPGVYFVLS